MDDSHTQAEDRSRVLKASVHPFGGVLGKGHHYLVEPQKSDVDLLTRMLCEDTQVWSIHVVNDTSLASVLASRSDSVPVYSVTSLAHARANVALWTQDAFTVREEALNGVAVWVSYLEAARS